MKKILAYWIVILAIYGVLLAFSRDYKTLSILYHLALLFLPLVFIFRRIETFKNLGFKKGNAQAGALWLIFVLISLIAGVYLRAFLLHQNVSLVFDFSLLFIVTITLGPISEELFHRGLLQSKLEQKWGQIMGMVFPSILFALIHIPKMLFAQDYIYVSAIPLLAGNPIALLFSFFVFGMMFAYIYQETKSIYYAILAHIFVNLILGILRY